TKRHGIVRDRNHIVSHGQLQPYNRNDPGPNWPWSHYIDRVREICGDTGGGGGGGGGSTQGIIVDSNNANNDASVAKIELTGTWTSSTSNAGYYGSGYWTANTAQTSAPATFKFYLPAAGTRTIEAWWTTGSNRASAAPFIAFNANGTEVGRKLVNQQQNGSQWVTLGTWNFSAGWNSVVLSRWTDSGTVVIADAIRVK
ncbi:MAG TPA: N-acetylmuramoyl-L-alanine amidase, partial [Kofleriaceae bacterium]|nr:N-acetylmuramoyl-L-alanine amidase [Kofleriaceae bacterium]